MLCPGLSLKGIQKLQAIENAAVQTLLEGVHVTPPLPTCFRIQLKGLVITCKASSGLGPGYLRNCLPQ